MSQRKLSASLGRVDRGAGEVNPLEPVRGSAWMVVDLTPRERLVLTELARGQTTKGMASTVYLSPHTVRSHIKSAIRKLGARTRSHAVAIAVSAGAIEVDAPAA